MNRSHRNAVSCTLQQRRRLRDLLQVSIRETVLKASTCDCCLIDLSALGCGLPVTALLIVAFSELVVKLVRISPRCLCCFLGTAQILRRRRLLLPPLPLITSSTTTATGTTLLLGRRPRRLLLLLVICYHDQILE